MLKPAAGNAQLSPSRLLLLVQMSLLCFCARSCKQLSLPRRSGAVELSLRMLSILHSPFSILHSPICCCSGWYIKPQLVYLASMNSAQIWLQQIAISLAAHPCHMFQGQRLSPC